MEKLVDIEKVFEEKNPKLLKIMPRFVINYLKRITHEDDVNQRMYELRDVKDAEFCKAVIEYFGAKVIAKGLENIPRTGGVLFACNHPLGGMDAMALVQVVHPIRPDIKFIVNDVLLKIDNIKSMFHGVNKHGPTARESLRRVQELFAGDDAIFIFPAGLVSRRRKGIIRDLEWKKTFITQAKRNRKPVVPVYLGGRLSNFFYRLANLRTALGIKSNIEMLYLADEMFKQKGVTIPIVFGKPIPPETFDKSKSDYEWAQWVKEKAYALKDRL